MFGELRFVFPLPAFGFIFDSFRHVFGFVRVFHLRPHPAALLDFADGFGRPERGRRSNTQSALDTRLGRIRLLRPGFFHFISWLAAFESQRRLHLPVAWFRLRFRRCRGFRPDFGSLAGYARLGSSPYLQTGFLGRFQRVALSEPGRSHRLRMRWARAACDASGAALLQAFAVFAADFKLQAQWLLLHTHTHTPKQQ